jgi:pentatricopeptide repeat domain-containing protein 1
VYTSRGGGGGAGARQRPPARADAPQTLPREPRPAPQRRPQPPRTDAQRAAFAAAIVRDIEALPPVRPSLALALKRTTANSPSHQRGDVGVVARRGLEYAPRFLVNGAIAALGAKGNWQAALQLLSWMERRASEDGPECPEAPNEHSFVAFLGGCRCGASLTHARRVWAKLAPPRGELPGARVCSAMLGALGRGGEAQEAAQLFSTMAWDGVPRGLHAYNAALTAAARAGAWKEAVDMFREFDSDNVEPDAYSLALAVTACSRGGVPHVGLALALSPTASRVVLDAAAAGAVISAAGAAGRLDVAYATLKRLDAQGSPRNTWLLNALLAGQASVGAAGPARDTLAYMRATPGCEPDARSYTSLMEVARVRGSLPHVRAALAELQAAGLRPTSVTLTVFLTALGDAGEWAEALDALQRWPDEHGMRVSTKAYSAALRACAKANRPQEALALFRDMQAQRVLPSVGTFAAMLPALEAAGMTAEADELRELRASLAALGVLPAHLERDEPTPMLMRMPRSVLGEAPDDDE